MMFMLCFCCVSVSVWWLLVVCGLFVLFLVFVKQGDCDQLMKVDVKYFDGFQKFNMVSMFKGSVVIQQGMLKVIGVLVKVYFDVESQISCVVLIGSFVYIEQFDDSGNQMLGDVVMIDYDNIKGIVVFIGNVLVKQYGCGEVYGDKFIYDIVISQMIGESGGIGIVYMVFQLKKKVVVLVVFDVFVLVISIGKF